MVHTFSQAYIVVDYLINTEVITKVFCINKGKPKMHCNGKCYLAKQLKKDEDKKSKNFEISTEIMVICQSSNLKITHKKVDFPLLRKDTFNYNEPLAFVYCGTVFHPPILSI